MSHQDLTGQVIKIGHYFAFGGLSDVYRGRWTNNTTGEVTVVAVKILRGTYAASEEWQKLVVRLSREASVWNQLRHPNILPFLGVSNDVGEKGASPGLISPLCENGHILDFILRNPKANRLQLALGVATGLQYLHSNDVIHGDLKGTNVLISDEGIPLLCDFGRSRIIGYKGYTSRVLGTVVYQAPELIMPEEAETNEESTTDSSLAKEEIYNDKLTKKSDVYAYAMVVLEVLTGKAPYYYIKTIHAKTSTIVKGEKLRRAAYDSPEMTNACWAILSQCWAFRPDPRPEMGLIISSLSVLL